MVLSWLSRLHGIFVAWALLFLVSSLLLAAGSGFEMDRNRYRSPELTGNNGMPAFVLGLFRNNAQGRTALLLDAAEASSDYVGMDHAVIERLANSLTKAGMNVIRSDGKDAIQLGTGADVAILTCNLPAYVNIDFDRLAAVMTGKTLLDYAGFWNSADADAAGLVMRNAARIYWPHWQDPEFATYVAHLRDKVTPTDGILLIPGGRLSTTAARARWYLALNEELSPRRLYLRNPGDGTSFVTEYFEWVREYNRYAPWKGTQKVRLQQRDLSTLNNLAPTRTLSADEVNAARSRDIQWVLFWSHQPDFRLADWELVALDDVLTWTAEATR